jgi:anti-sigma factor ChrR (cupin superfamily)
MEELIIKTTEVAWEPAVGYPEGTQWKVLRRDAEGEPSTAILMLPGGFSIADHSHRFSEQHYVLEGEYTSGNRRFGAGAYRLIPKEEDYRPIHSDRGAVVLVVRER